MMRLASVCSGISGAELAFAGIAHCVWAAETEAFPRAVLRHHYPDLKLYGDFRDIESPEPVDVLAGGTPCQSFSVAGLRRGLADARGNLALEYLRLVDRIRPSWVLWENVPGVLSSNGGRDFGAFLGGLGECGYGWAYRCLDAQHFGLAQRRKRVFVVGCAGDWRRAAAVLFEPAGLRGDPAPRREAGQGTAPTLASRATAGGGLGTDFDCDGGLIAFGGGNTAGSIDVATARTHHASRHDFDSETFIAHALPTCNGGGYVTEDGTGRGIPVIAHSLRADGFDAGEACSEECSEVYSERSVAVADGTGRGTPLVAMAFHQNQRAEVTTNDTTGALTSGGGKPGQGYPAVMAIPLKEPTAKGLAGALRNSVHGNADDPMFTLQAEKRHGVATAALVRRLTPTECARLQGFPDDWLDITYRGKPAADGPKYRALGNAFAVPVVRWIARRIAREHAQCAVAA